MTTPSLIQLTLDTLRCTQRDLAAKLGVSPAQVSKWKKGEYMSIEMSQRLRALTGIGDIDPDFILLAGTMEDAKKWQLLIRHLADTAVHSAETGYETVPLTEDIQEDSCPIFFDTLKALQDMGIEIPSQYPEELDINFQNDEHEELIYKNNIVFIINEIFDSLNNVYGFYSAFVSGIIYDEDLDLIDTPVWELENDMLRLAASKIEIDKDLTPEFIRFKWTIETEVAKKLSLLKEYAFKSCIPLKAELLDLAYASHDELGREADAHSLGFTRNKIHPDIYLNELLTGMRVIHQVLPVIMKKLDIYEDFKIDTSELSAER